MVFHKMEVRIDYPFFEQTVTQTAQALCHAGDHGRSDGRSLEHGKTIRHDKPFGGGPPGSIDEKAGRLILLPHAAFFQGIEKLVAQRVDEQTALLMNSCNMASSYSEIEEQGGTVLLMMTALPESCARQ